MLNLSPWRHLPLVVHFSTITQGDVLENAKKKNVKIPSHVRVESGEMSALDAYVKVQSTKSLGNEEETMMNMENNEDILLLS